MMQNNICCTLSCHVVLSLITDCFSFFLFQQDGGLKAVVLVLVGPGPAAPSAGVVRGVQLSLEHATGDAGGAGDGQPAGGILKEAGGEARKDQRLHAGKGPFRLCDSMMPIQLT